MSAADDDRAGRGGLVCFGMLAASVTHELNNVLSIIDQAGGLLGDLTAGAAAGQAIDPRRIETVRERIDRQVRKGVGILNRLNRFAHSIDEPAARFDVVGETENLVGLTRRFAELRQARLELAPCAEEILVAGDAFALQQALFACLRIALDGAGEGDRIDIRLRRDGDEAVVELRGPAPLAGDGKEPRLAEAEGLMASLGGSCLVRSAPAGGVEFELRVPAAAGSGA